MTVTCPRCNRKLKVPEAALGRKGRCPSCGQVMRLQPSPDGTEPPGADSSTYDVDALAAALAAQAASAESAGVCPSCGAGMAPEAVLCAHCGFDSRRGAAAGSEVAAAPAGEAARPPVWAVPVARPPMGYESEAAERRRHMLGLGLVLLAAFLMPIMVPGFGAGSSSEWIFVNLEVFRQEVPWQVAVVMLAPAVGGVGIILASRLLRHPVRGAVICALPILPVLLLLLDEEVARDVKFAFSATPTESKVLLILWCIALIGLLVGIRTRWYRPANPAAYVVGCVGGGTYALSLLLPVLPSEAGYIALVTPFKLFDVPRMVLFGFGLLMAMLCMIAASVICIVNRPGIRDDFARNRARAALWLLVSGQAAGVLFTLMTFLQALPEDGAASFAASVFLIFVKGGAMMFGMILLLPFGLIDLLVGPMRPPAAAP